MPELPEVEAIARTLWPWVPWRTIRRVHVFHPILLRPQSIADFGKLTKGAHIRNVRRLGKYLFLNLDRELIEIHFRFVGNSSGFQTRAN